MEISPWCIKGSEIATLFIEGGLPVVWFHVNYSEK